MPHIGAGRINKLIALGMLQQRHWINSRYLLCVKLTAKGGSHCNEAPVAQFLICLRCAALLENPFGLGHSCQGLEYFLVVLGVWRVGDAMVSGLLLSDWGVSNISEGILG